MPAIPVNGRRGEGRGGGKEIFSECRKESRGNRVARQFLECFFAKTQSRLASTQEVGILLSFYSNTDGDCCISLVGAGSHNVTY